MTSPLFRAEIVARVKHAITRAENASLFEHNGLAGHAREIFIHDMLRPILPAMVAIGTGKISDSKGQLSNECDVILYGTGFLPPLLLTAAFGMFPIESALYCFEVKSKTSAAEVKDAIAKARRLRTLNWGKGGVRPNVVLFAYGSDLTQKSELDRYRDLDPDNETDPALTAICVVGQGYWFSRVASKETSKWGFFPPTPAHDEAVDLLAGLSNTVPRMIAAKGIANLGPYFSDRSPVDA